MMQMLQLGGMEILTDGIRTADDDNPRGYYELEAVKQTKQSASWLEDAPGKAVKVIYWLLRDLPGTYQYRVLIMNRAVSEVTSSQRVMLDRRGETGADVSPAELQRIFVQELQNTKAWLAKQLNFEVIDIDYAKLLADAVSQAEEIRRFLGIDLDVEAMAGGVDRGLYRQRT